MATKDGGFPANLLVLDGKNWRRWSVQMKVIFGYQGVTEIIEAGISTAQAATATDAEKEVHKELKRKIARLSF